MNGKMSKSGMSLLLIAIVALSAILLTIPVMAIGEITATRDISKQSVAPGGNFTVTVTVTANQDVTAPALDEELPGGWTVTEVDSAGATFKSSTTEWIWLESLSSGASKTVIYSVTVPADATEDTYSITGSISAYGVDTIAVGDESKITVSTEPALTPTSPQTTPTLMPTPTPTPSPTLSPTLTSMPESTLTPSPASASPAPPVEETPAPTATLASTPVATATPTATPEEPGFEAVFAIAGLLAIAYLVLRRRRNA